MPKLSKQAGIELIIEELKKSTSKVDVMAMFGKQWQTPKDTFNKWWIIAQKKHTEAQSEVNSIVKEQTIDAEIEAKKRAINDRNRRLAILNTKFEELAEVKPITVKTKDGKEIKITKGDYLKTIEVMAKLDDRISKAEGTDAPTKQAQTDVNGNDLKDRPDWLQYERPN